MPYISTGQLNEIISILRDVKRDSKMEHANFNDLIGTPEQNIVSTNCTEFIKNKTQRFRDSWITSPVEECIEILEKLRNQ